MKGFPNQIANIEKLTSALLLLTQRINGNLPLDDNSLGEALLRENVIQPRDKSESVDDYLSRMRTKPSSGQSHRATGRGLKEFFHLTGVLSSQGQLTSIGSRTLEAKAAGNDSTLFECWRAVMRQTIVQEAGRASHPYRILLRLISDRPGTSRALSPLALEADDDSDREYQRILLLRDLDSEVAIQQQIGVSKTNWNNAKKILPPIAIQLGDITESKDGLRLTQVGVDEQLRPTGLVNVPPARVVNRDTIARARKFDETEEWPSTVEATESGLLLLQAAIEKRNHRSFLHNNLVQAFAQTIPADMLMMEGVFDLGAFSSTGAVLAEIKTLDGTPEDEREQVRKAVAQLLYYEALCLPDSFTSLVNQGKPLVKIAVFDNEPTDQHIGWMEGLEIAVTWLIDGRFSSSSYSNHAIRDILGIQFT